MQARFFVGGYTPGFSGMEGRGPGITVLDLELATGQPRVVSTSKDIANPSYLALDSRRGLLFAASELMEEEGPAVLSFAIASDGTLTPRGRADVAGSLPCHLSFDPTGNWLACATYLGGTLELFAVAADGTLTAAGAPIRRRGSGPNLGRQEASHAHCALFGPEPDMVNLVDLGTDSLARYRLDGAARRLTGPVGTMQVAAGSGPRHLALAGDMGLLFSELDESLRLLRLEDGAWRELACSAGFSGSGEPAGAAVKYWPEGGFAYVSSRRSHEIAVFKLNRDAGGLQRLGAFSCHGKGPRDFAIDPTGRFFVIANQWSDTVSVVARDAETGLGGDCVAQLPLGTPSCVVFA